MLQSHAGELAALLTAVFWTITALAFESAGKKIGSVTVNLVRLFIAFIFLGIFTSFSIGSFFPAGASSHNWIWLSLSGLVGFVLGDLFLFRAYVVVGARISMLIMSLAPPIAALVGWIIMDETLSAKSMAGMAITFAGIAMVILTRQSHEIALPTGDQAAEDDKIPLSPAYQASPGDQMPLPRENGKKSVFRFRLRFSYPLAGLLLAFGGAAGQATGLVLSKYGMDGYDAFAATQIRIITGFAGFLIIYTLLGRWNRLLPALRNRSAMTSLGIGAFFGPFLGVSFSLLAVKYTSSGIAAAIMSIVPVLIIPFSVMLFREKPTAREILGAVVAIAGVAIFFL
jgi:drug/metabolite transporter (DMT)-like permease